MHWTRFATLGKYGRRRWETQSIECSITEIPVHHSDSTLSYIKPTPQRKRKESKCQRKEYIVAKGMVRCNQILNEEFQRKTSRLVGGSIVRSLLRRGHGSLWVLLEALNFGYNRP